MVINWKIDNRKRRERGVLLPGGSVEDGGWDSLVSGETRRALCVEVELWTVHRLPVEEEQRMGSKMYAREADKWTKLFHYTDVQRREFEKQKLGLQRFSAVYETVKKNRQSGAVLHEWRVWLLQNHLNIFLQRRE
jgi:hypothetical protein